MSVVRSSRPGARSVDVLRAYTNSGAEPVVADIHGVRQYITAGYTGAKGGGSLAGIDAKTGNKLWSIKYVTGDSYAISPTPIVKGKEIYATSSDGSHLFECFRKSR